MANCGGYSVSLVVCVLATLANAANAQTARSGGGANAQLMQQMQQLASERTSLQAENAQMKRDLDALRKERDSLKDAVKKAQQALDGRLKASEVALAHNTAQRESTEQELRQAKEKMQELVTKFRETINTLRMAESESTTAKQTLSSRERDLKACVDHNAALYKLNDEVLTRLEHQSIWSRVATAEPFTRIKRTELENLVDDYKTRADDHRLPSTLTSSPAAAEPQSLHSGSSPSTPTPSAPGSPSATQGEASH